MTSDEYAEIKNDLIRGIKLDKTVAVEHYVDNPEKIILSICELAIKKNNEWVSRNEIVYGLAEKIGNEQITVISNGRRITPYLIDNGKILKKFNAIDWISKVFTDIKNQRRVFKRDILPRWFNIFERNEDTYSKSEKWKYKIRHEYYGEIKKILETIKVDSNLTEKTRDISIEPQKIEETQKSHTDKNILFGDKTPQHIDNGLVRAFEQTPKPLYNYFEKDVEEKLFDELHKLGLKIYEDAKGRNGRQFDTFEVGRIDLLCTDSEGNFVVLELKKGNANQDVISQIQKYMGWVGSKLAKDGQQVKGVILTERHDKNLEYAVRANSAISIKHYKVGIEIVD